MQLEVTYSYTSPDNDNLQGYRLALSATGTDIPSEVFVCQRRVPSATDPAYNDLPDKFISLADPVDLEQYPAGSPDLGGQVPFYRVSEITLVFRTVQELEETKVMLDADIRELVHSLKTMEAATVTEEISYA